MRLASCSINSIDLRKDRALGFLDQLQPDVLCLQQIKVAEYAPVVADFDLSRPG